MNPRCSEFRKAFNPSTMEEVEAKTVYKTEMS